MRNARSCKRAVEHDRVHGSAEIKGFERRYWELGRPERAVGPVVMRNEDGGKAGHGNVLYGRRSLRSAGLTKSTMQKGSAAKKRCSYRGSTTPRGEREEQENARAKGAS